MSSAAVIISVLRVNAIVDIALWIVYMHVYLLIKPLNNVDPGAIFHCKLCTWTPGATETPDL